MTRRFIITIDDDDRDDCPDTPWTAAVRRGRDGEVLGVGVGYTYREALADINWGEVGTNEED